MQWAQRRWGVLATGVRFETPEAKLDNYAYALGTYGAMAHCGNAVLARAPDGAELPVNHIRGEAGTETLLNPAMRQWLSI